VTGVPIALRDALANGWALVISSARSEAVVAGVLGFLLFFHGTAALQPFGRDEARFAQAAREMLDRGDLVVPTFAGSDRYDKPILIYWCTVVSYRVFGVGPRSARLPSNVSGAVCVALIAWSARRRFGAGAGLLAGTMMASTLTFHLQARACTADMVMMLPAVVAILALERLMSSSCHRWVAPLMWIGLGVAVLAKGPVAPVFVGAIVVGVWSHEKFSVVQIVAGVAVLVIMGWWFGPLILVIPVLVAVVGLARSPQWRARMSRSRPLLGVILIAAVVAPWAVWVWVATEGEFFREAFGHHVIERSVTALESHRGFPGFYPVTGFVVALPWFALVLPATADAFRRTKVEPQMVYLLAWLIGPMVVLETVQTKLVHYWMLSYPAGILLVTGWLLSRSRGSRGLGRGTGALMALSALFAAALPVVGMQVLDLDQLRPRAMLSGLPLVVAAFVIVLAGRTRPVSGALAMAGGCALTMVVLAGHLLPAVVPFTAAYRTASRALAERGPGDTLVVLRPRDDEIFFQLPLDTPVCRSWRCFERVASLEPPVLGIARLDDFEHYRDTPEGADLLKVAIVEGVDPGRGRWVANALFRPSPEAASGGIDGS